MRRVEVGGVGDESFFCSLGGGGGLGSRVREFGFWKCRARVSGSGYGLRVKS